MKTRKQQQTVIDSKQLALAIRTAKGNQSWREIGSQIGLGHMTIRRIMIEHRVPDIDNYVKICHWLKCSLSTFVKSRL